MKVRYLNTTALLAARGAEAVAEMADDWQDEGSAAALAGNPRRADYLEWWANRARVLANQVLHGQREPKI